MSPNMSPNNDVMKPEQHQRESYAAYPVNTRNIFWRQLINLCTSPISPRESISWPNMGPRAYDGQFIALAMEMGIPG